MTNIRWEFARQLSLAQEFFGEVLRYSPAVPEWWDPMVSATSQGRQPYS